MVKTPASVPIDYPKATSLPVVIFDGECPFCQNWVRFLVRTDRKNRLLYAPAQSAFVSLLVPLMQQKGVDPGKEVLVFHRGDFYTGHESIFYILKILGGGWRLLLLLRFLPDTLLRKVYGWVAINRYRLKIRYRNSCPIDNYFLSGRFLK